MAVTKKFFSYATVATMSQPAYAAALSFLNDFYTVGPPEVLYKYEPYAALLAEEAATLLHCSPDEITTIKNTTEGIIIASEALPLLPGDEVLVLGNEYPANLLPWLKKKKDGIVVTVIPGNDNEAAYRELINRVSPKTKVIAISAAQYYDGYMADIAELAKLRERFGLYVVLDAVQIVGVRKLDLSSTPVDFMVCGSQKYLRAGMGSGILYVNQAILPNLKDTKVGIRSMAEFTNDAYTLKTNTDRFQDGTQNLLGIIALHAALHAINSVGIERIEQQNLQLLHQIKACLDEYAIPFIDHGARQANIVSIPTSNAKALFEYLKDQSVYLRPTKDVIRLSFIHESTMADVRYALGLVRRWISENS